MRVGLVGLSVPCVAVKRSGATCCAACALMHIVDVRRGQRDGRRLGNRVV